MTLLKEGKTAEARVEVDRAEAIFKAQGAAGDSYLKSFPALRQRLAVVR